MNEDTAALQIDRPAPVEASDDTTPWKRIVVPLDGSPVAEAVIPTAGRMARRLGLEMVLLRVVRDEPPRVIDSGRQIVIDETARRRQEAEQYLRAIAARLTASGLRVRTDVRAGDAARGILEAARECEADVIAMTTHGRGALGRLLYGSVTGAVLHRAHLPVVVVRASGAEKTSQAA